MFEGLILCAIYCSSVINYEFRTIRDLFKKLVVLNNAYYTLKFDVQYRNKGPLINFIKITLNLIGNHNNN